ncbi:MAG TPA: hypothetical protein VLA92_00560 [Candidatus Saccharimonadales bacterium]|nr:hypothetical protein [Candidatus Saccharimonadales bacterium]
MIMKQDGYIALISVLVIGAVSTAAALVLLSTGADSQRTALVAQQSTQARSLAMACAEEALQVVHDDTSYVGTGNLSLGQGSCSYTVTNTGGSNRTITATGTVGTVVRKIQAYATIESSSISVSLWQEVS